MTSSPIRLAGNYITRFYRGGQRLAAFRGEPVSDYQPEDWVGSVTTASGSTDGSGLSRLPDGGLLADAIAADPAGYLGAAHVAAFGPAPELLVKLLDAGERLPVHCHPDRAFAAGHLDCRHGKTEAWVILEAPEDAAVYLGFREDVPAEVLRTWLDEQDTAAMLAATHRLPVRAGDAILVPAGTPHAIGAGVLLTELQEPTDFSILLEWRGFAADGPHDGHLGVGFDLALSCVDRSRWTPARLAAVRLPEPELLAPGVRRLLPALADPFFRAERVTGGAALDPGYSVLVMTVGELDIVDGTGARTTARVGETILLPYGAGPCHLAGSGTAIRCRPPAATSGQPIDTTRAHAGGLSGT